MLNSLFGDKNKEVRKITIAEILKGAEAGRMQSVGYLQVIPLLSDIQEERIVSPEELRVSTSGYGSMVFENGSGKVSVVPAHAGYVVKQAAQDHAMAGAGFVGKRRNRSFDNAMCVQQSQGGYIKPDKHKMMILPFSLREHAYDKLGEKGYNKLWQSISEFNERLGLKKHGHVEYFMDKFKEELDQFVAEFEPVPRQIGALVLLDGKLVGVERAPNYSYWLSIWPALIRECYGSLAIEYRKSMGDQPRPPQVKVPLPDQVASLEELQEALKKAREAEEEMAREKVRELIEDEFTRKREDKMEGFTMETVHHDQLFGQIVLDEGQMVVYASLVLRDKWDKKRARNQAKPFSL